MYKNWGSFRAMVDVVEMVLSKSEPAIAAHYDKMLVKDPKAKELGEEVRKSHLATEDAILNLTEHTVLAENNPILLRQMGVRNRYVDCLNVLQAETLKRLREKGDDEVDKVLQDALLISITGVANGMGNTG
jgi:phosphoenolpyruvate carboxylase